MKIQVEETEDELKKRLWDGYSCLIEVDAVELKKSFEVARGRIANYVKRKLESIRVMTVATCYPKVYRKNSGVYIQDGWHRMYVSAERGDKIDIAVKEGEVAWFRERFGDS